MTGSLQQKNGKYYAVLNLRENGKRKQKWIDSGLVIKGNKTRAERFLREQISLYERQEQLVTSDMLFSDYVRYWLTTAKNRIDIVTYQGYEYLIKKYIFPYFTATGVSLQKVTVQTLQAYFNEKATKGKEDGKNGLSPSSLRKHRAILHQALKQAAREGYIQLNPCDLVELPKAQKYEPHFCTKEQFADILNAAKNSPLYAILLITTVYGLRRSELCGLQWGSVNFERDTLTIEHTVIRAQSVVEKDTTKTAASHRSYPLLPQIKELLLQIRESQKENRRLFKKEYIDTPYIFTWDDGKPISPDYISHGFSKLLRQNGLPIIRFHDLRHTCASMLLSDGANLKDVQEWLGHADIGMTANTYGHLDMQRKKHLGNSMEKLVF